MANQWDGQCISPQMIIMRIADGKAWTRSGVITTPAIRLRPIASGEAVPSIESGAKANSRLQSRSSDPDLSS